MSSEKKKGETDSSRRAWIQGHQRLLAPTDTLRGDFCALAFRQLQGPYPFRSEDVLRLVPARPVTCGFKGGSKLDSSIR